LIIDKPLQQVAGGVVFLLQRLVADVVEPFSLLLSVTQEDLENFDLERVFSFHRVGECFGQWIAVYQVDALALLVAPAKKSVSHRQALLGAIFQLVSAGNGVVAQIGLVLIDRPEIGKIHLAFTLASRFDRRLIHRQHSAA
jgi:hypothetical protein